MSTGLFGSSWSEKKVEKGELKGYAPCMVEERINYLFNVIKRCNDLIEEDRKNGNFDFYREKQLCQTSIEKITEIETLALVLHPNYRMCFVDKIDLSRFLCGKEDMIRIHFCGTRNSVEQEMFRYFKPKKESAK